jgi:hypothetical protein
MWLSKLKQMSVGPLWVVREQGTGDRGQIEGRVDSPQQSDDYCPVCGAAWAQTAAQDSTWLVVLASPVTDPAQLTLLQNCLRAAGHTEGATCLTLHDSCQGQSDSVLQALATQINLTAPETIFIFGETTAQLIDKEWRRGQIYAYCDTRLVVTHSLHDMLVNPMLKAQVWADFCLVR